MLFHNSYLALTLNALGMHAHTNEFQDLIYLRIESLDMDYPAFFLGCRMESFSIAKKFLPSLISQKWFMFFSNS